MLVIQLKDGLLILNTVFYEPVLVLLEGNGIEKLIDFRVVSTSTIACTSIDLSVLFCSFFLRLLVNRIGYVTGYCLGPRVLRWQDPTEEWVAGLIGRLASGCALPWAWAI